MRNRLIIGALALAALGSAALAAVPPASAWEIGPIIRGKNYSVGMPLQPAPTRTGWFFDFPYPSRDAGHVHYVTFDPGSLAGKSRLVVRYRIDAARGTRFVSQETPDQTATVSLFFQRRGDNWSAKGRYADYRWYAPPNTVRPLAPGVHEIAISLDDPQWGSVWSQTAAGDPHAFQASLANASRLGLVFGTRSARGHGVFATGPARFELLSFRVE
jgi:hypothetical protein